MKKTKRETVEGLLVAGLVAVTMLLTVLTAIQVIGVLGH
jgi:hypothetical protein